MPLYFQMPPTSKLFLLCRSSAPPQTPAAAPLFCPPAVNAKAKAKGADTQGAARAAAALPTAGGRAGGGGGGGSVDAAEEGEKRRGGEKLAYAGRRFLEPTCTYSSWSEKYKQEHQKLHTVRKVLNLRRFYTCVFLTIFRFFR